MGHAPEKMATGAPDEPQGLLGSAPPHTALSPASWASPLPVLTFLPFDSQTLSKQGKKQHSQAMRDCAKGHVTLHTSRLASSARWREKQNRQPKVVCTKRIPLARRFPKLCCTNLPSFFSSLASFLGTITKTKLPRPLFPTKKMEKKKLPRPLSFWIILVL